MLKKLVIGSLELPHNVVLAPLAGITNLPFRRICHAEGAALGFTEMVSVNGLVREGAKTLALLRSCPEDRPLGIQLFGDKADDLAEAARMVEGYGDLLDINMGCPVRKVVGTGAGSALLQDTRKIAGILSAVRRATSLPLTIKIRSGWHTGDTSYLEVGRIAVEEGVDAVTLHPRSRAQMFSGQADWEQIRRLKDAVTIPVLGSGDLFTSADALAMLEQTGCDGAMIARGALGNPWIFRHIRQMDETGTAERITNAERAEMIGRHLDLFADYGGEAVATREMKKHIGWYARGFAGAADVRREANGVRSITELRAIIDRIAVIADAEAHG